MYDRAALEQLIREKALRFGEFTLASGKSASYYLDCRQLTLDSVGAQLIAAGMWEQLGDPLPQAVGGMAIGADPITGALLATAGAAGQPLRGVIVRKQPKQHGTGRTVEGPVAPGEEIMILEDVVTTGGSALRAIEQCEAFGLRIRGVLAIIDRLEGGREAFAAAGHSLRTLFTIRDFGIEPE